MVQETLPPICGRNPSGPTAASLLLVSKVNGRGSPVVVAITLSDVVGAFIPAISYPTWIGLSMKAFSGLSLLSLQAIWTLSGNIGEVAELACCACSDTKPTA